MEFRCYSCNGKRKFEFVSRSAIDAHNRSIHRELLGKEKCKFCGTLFRTKSELETHTLSVHGELLNEKHLCKICGKLFGSKLGLETHISIVHGHLLEEKHLCEVCHSFSKPNQTWRRTFVTLFPKPNQTHCEILHKIIKNIVTDKSEGIGYVYFNEENEMKAAIKEMNHKCLGERLMVVANDPLATWNYQDPCGSGICRFRCNGVGGMNGEECFKCGLPGHLPKECKLIIKGGRNRGRDGRRGCFKCGKPGHLAKDCQISGSWEVGIGRGQFPCMRPVPLFLFKLIRKVTSCQNVDF